MISRSRIIVLWVLAILLLSGVVFVALADHTPNPNTHLKAVGPVSPEHGFPVWYADANDMTLELCLDNVVNCLLPFSPPYTFPMVFPDEAFYFAAAATMPTGAGSSADIGLDLEAAFVNGLVVPGEQMVFGRIRIRMDDLQPGAAYLVTHPYGEDVVIAGPDGSVFVTEDIGNMTGGPNFGEALNSRIGPFLTWDTYPGDPNIPAGYIGDVNVEHAVVGSPFGTNFFRVEGPVGSFPFSPNQCADVLLGDDPVATDDCIEIDQFTVMGKLSATAGVQPISATYVRDASGGAIDVIALSQPGQVIHVKGTDLNQTAMRGDDTGNYYARLNFSGIGDPPALSVSNAGDDPPTVAQIVTVDQVIVTEAVFDADAQTLAVNATSTDQLIPPTLTVYREDGTTLLGTVPLLLSDVLVPPARVLVRSSAGGMDTEQVQIVGTSFPTLPLVAMAGPDQTVPQGTQVILDGSNSTGDISTYAWTQTNGTSPVQLANANSAIASFTAGLAGESYSFTLTVDDNPDVQPASVDEVVITVADVTAPTANAGPDQGPSQSVVQGATITLDGSASSGVTDFHWIQLPDGTAVANGPTAEVVLTNADPVEFQLEVTGPGGADTDTVLITPLQDILAVNQAQFRINKSQWDVRGTATVLGVPAGLGNTISIYRDAAHTDLIGTVDVDNLGDWRLRTNVAGPNAGNQIYIVSSRGGSTVFAVAVRN